MITIRYKTHLSIRNRPISLACSHQISTKKLTDFETMLRKFVGYNGIQLI